MQEPVFGHWANANALLRPCGGSRTLCLGSNPKHGHGGRWAPTTQPVGKYANQAWLGLTVFKPRIDAAYTA